MLIVAAIAVTLVIACFLIVFICFRVLRRRYDRLTWKNIVARNRGLDIDLEKIWRRR